MKYTLLFLLAVGCSERPDPGAKPDTTSSGVIEPTESKEDNDLGKRNIPVPEDLRIASSALPTIQSKLKCEECGIKRDAEYKAGIRYFVDCDGKKYIVDYDAEKDQVLNVEETGTP